MSADAEGHPPELLTALAGIVAAPTLRPFLVWLLDQCDVEGRSGNELREGQRDIGRRVLDLLDAADPRIKVTLANLYAGDLVKARAAGDDG